MTWAQCMRQNVSLSRVGRGKNHYSEVTNEKETAENSFFWLSKSGQVRISVLAVAHLSYWMNSFGVLPPVFFLPNKACANVFPWQLCYFSFSWTTCRVGNPWAVKPNTWVPVRWLRQLNYRWIWASQHCSRWQDYSFGKRESSVYQWMWVLLYRWHMKLYTLAFNPVWFWMIKYPLWTLKIGSFFLIQASCSSLQPSTQVERGLSGPKKVCGLLLFLHLG